MNTIDLSQIPPLAQGGHASLTEGACFLEAVSYVAGEPWSDHPECVCPVIATFLRTWNDGLPDGERDELLRPLIPLVMNTRATTAIERRRAMLAADWLVREHAPAWLRLAKLNVHADALAALPEITDTAQCPSLMPVLKAARTDAAAARATASGDTLAAAGAAARAARAAAFAAAWAAAGDDLGAASGDVLASAAGDAARAAASRAAALQPTRLALQRSALRLVHRMIAVAEVRS